jgi:ketosteroid isomerase-like protein
VTDLSQKLQYLVDRQEILDCIYRYPRALDRHDDELLASVFHDDAIDNHGRWVGGREEFVQWANHECHNKLDAHMHHITTHNCEIDGDVAHTESYVMFVHRYKDGETVHVAGGRYVDRLEKRDGEWRISLRRLVLDYRYLADGKIFGDWDGYLKGTQDLTDISYERPLELPAELREELELRGVSAGTGAR